MVLWTPTAETSQPNLSFLQKHKSNKTCFITIHKILMFAISHAACQTLHALLKTLKVHVIPYKYRKSSSSRRHGKHTFMILNWYLYLILIQKTKVLSSCLDYCREHILWSFHKNWQTQKGRSCFSEELQHVEPHFLRFNTHVFLRTQKEQWCIKHKQTEL